MKTRICLAGATGWVGRALVKAIAGSDKFELASALGKASAGKHLGKFLDIPEIGVIVDGKISDANDEATKRALTKNAFAIQIESELNDSLVDKREPVKNAAQNRRCDQAGSCLRAVSNLKVLRFESCVWGLKAVRRIAPPFSSFHLHPLSFHLLPSPLSVVMRREF